MGAAIDEYVMRRPIPQLRQAVGAYSGYRQHGLAPALHRGLPSPYLTFIFTLDDPLHIVRHTDAAQTPGYYDSLVGGLHTTPALIHHDGAQSGVQVSLSPLWARRLFGLPAGEIANLDVTAGDLLGHSVAARIQDRLRAARTWSQRFSVLDRELLALLDGPAGAVGGGGVAAEVRFTWDGLRRSGGTTSIGELIRESGWSDRHLANRFRHETGLTPKAAARVIRFDRVRRRLQRDLGSPSAAPMADIAAEFGYYDQSHLVREFTALAGSAPTRWLAAEFDPPNRQEP